VRITEKNEGKKLPNWRESSVPAEEGGKNQDAARSEADSASEGASFADVEGGGKKKRRKKRGGNARPLRPAAEKIPLMI